MMATDRDFDVIVIGAGTAGLSAALFTTREKLKTLMIERMTFGGQIANAETIENYPGLPASIRGIDLAVNMLDQIKPYGLQTAFTEVEALHVDRRPFVVVTGLGSYTGKVIILACGSSLKRLDVPGESAFEGRGVSYCATCDGGMFHNQEVAVVGGGDSAMDEALYLTELAAKVTAATSCGPHGSCRSGPWPNLRSPGAGILWSKGSRAASRWSGCDSPMCTRARLRSCRWLGCLSMLACSLTPNFCKVCCRWMLAGMCRSTSAWKRRSPGCMPPVICVSIRLGR
jgi:hypothetical protein